MSRNSHFLSCLLLFATFQKNLRFIGACVVGGFLVCFSFVFRKLRGQTSRTKAEPRSYEKTMEEGARERLKRVSVFFPLPPPPSFSSLTSFQLSHGCIPYFTKHKRTHPLETKQNKTAATYAG